MHSHDKKTNHPAPQSSLVSAKAIRRLLDRLGGFPTRKRERRARARFLSWAARTLPPAEQFTAMAWNFEARWTIHKALAADYSEACKRKTRILSDGSWVFDAARESLVHGQFGVALEKAASLQPSSPCPGQGAFALERSKVLAPGQPMGTKLDSLCEPESGNSNRPSGGWPCMELSTPSGRAPDRPGQDHGSGGGMAPTQSQANPILSGARAYRIGPWHAVGLWPTIDV